MTFTYNVIVEYSTTGFMMISKQVKFLFAIYKSKVRAYTDDEHSHPRTRHAERVTDLIYDAAKHTQVPPSEGNSNLIFQFCMKNI